MNELFYEDTDYSYRSYGDSGGNGRGSGQGQGENPYAGAGKDHGFYTGDGEVMEDVFDHWSEDQFTFVHLCILIAIHVEVC